MLPRIGALNDGDRGSAFLSGKEKKQFCVWAGGGLVVVGRKVSSTQFAGGVVPIAPLLSWMTKRIGFSASNGLLKRAMRTIYGQIRFKLWR
jgi:hypothetical protein